MTIAELITATRAGMVLRNPAAWKDRTIVVNKVAALLSVALAIAQGAGYAQNLRLDSDVLASLAGGVWAVVAAFNAWSTAATSDKVGLFGPRPEDRLDPGNPGA